MARAAPRRPLARKRYPRQVPGEGAEGPLATPIGAGYCGPAVADGKVFVTDRLLDEGAANPDSGFTKNVVNGKDRLLCLDEKTGKILWKHEYPSKYEVSYGSGPRTTPVVRDGKVWAVGAMGEVFCLEAATGKEVWSKDFRTEFEATVPQWGFAGLAAARRGPPHLPGRRQGEHRGRLQQGHRHGHLEGVSAKDPVTARR